jgi:hypothetical protein
LFDGDQVLGLCGSGHDGIGQRDEFGRTLKQNPLSVTCGLGQHSSADTGATRELSS